MKLSGAALIDVCLVLTDGHLTSNRAVLPQTFSFELLSDFKQEFWRIPERTLLQVLSVAAEEIPLRKIGVLQGSIQHIENIVPLSLKLVDNWLHLQGKYLQIKPIRHVAFVPEGVQHLRRL